MLLLPAQQNPTTTGPLLAGVCSHFADLLHFNVWALRAVFIVLLLVKTVLAVIVYGVLALLFHAADRRRQPQDAAQAQAPANAPESCPHDERIRDLDRRFREWEQSLGK
ncbi:MAG: PspC domain-containing protein [Xanthomonadales bacterium]|nr:PspC domain-containing protein [Xanthomonadales bacterium]